MFLVRSLVQHIFLCCLFVFLMALRIPLVIHGLFCSFCLVFYNFFNNGAQGLKIDLCGYRRPNYFSRSAPATAGLSFFVMYNRHQNCLDKSLHRANQRCNFFGGCFNNNNNIGAPIKFTRERQSQYLKK